MNARFFYAAPIFSNSPKLMVLTEDSVLYSEHREFDVISVDKKMNINYSSFAESQFETEDYPILLEIGYQEARDMPLSGEPNWIDRYLFSKNISLERAMQA